MTGAEERRLLREYLQRCGRLHAGLSRSADRAKGLLPIAGDVLDVVSFDDEATILAFLKRFEQLEDSLGRTMKAIARMMAYGKIERESPVDIARRAYALGILDSEKKWGEAVRTRNALAHEYPLRPDKRAEQINAAWESVAILDETWNSILRFIEVERLLNDD